MSDRPASAQVTETKGVVAIDQHPFVIATNGHAAFLSGCRKDELLHIRRWHEIIL